MKFILKILIFLILVISFLNISLAYAFDIRKVNSAKIFSKASFEANDTNLIDKNNAENLKNNIEELKEVLIEEEKKIIKNNKNRKRRKTKGDEEIFEDFSNSVVFIGNRQKGRVKGHGSGFIVNHNGLKIITNWHVIEDADKIDVWLKPDRMVDDTFLISNIDSYSAEIIKVNKKKDLAMLSVKGIPISIKPLNYGKFSKVKIGETLFAIGHPNGLLWSFNSGMVSQLRPDYNWKYRASRHYANVIQIQVPINPGNSGGPLFNKAKQLVGVNTFTAEGENLNFAIAVDDVIEFLNEKAKPIKKKKNQYIKKKKKGPTWIKKKKKKKKSSDNFDLSNAIEADVNDNGRIDSWLIDANNNGIYEIAYGDSNEDGNIDVVAIDDNEDNNFEIIIIDENGNGNPEKAKIDENEDGKTDIIAYDFNEDGKWDKYKKV